MITVLHLYHVLLPVAYPLDVVLDVAQRLREPPWVGRLGSCGGHSNKTKLATYTASECLEWGACDQAGWQYLLESALICGCAVSFSRYPSFI